MATIADLWVTLGMKSDGFSKGIRSAENDLDSFASKAAAAGAKMASIGKGMTLALSVPIITGIGFAIDAASDLEEATSAATTTYGDMAAEVIANSKDVNEAILVSQQQYLSAATVLGVYGQGAGLTGDALVGFGEDALTAAQDLSSFYNVPLDVALAAWQSGLSGETEPMRQFGIFMNEAELQAFALTTGIWDGSTAMTEQQKILARQNFMLSEMGPAQGDAARTAGGLANQQRILKKNLSDTAAVIGKHLIPAALKLVSFLGKMLGAFEQLSPSVQKWIVMIALAVAAIGPLLMGLGFLLSAFAPIGVAIGLLLSPIGLVIAAIGLLAFAFRGPIFSAIGEVIGRIREFVSDITKVYDRLRQGALVYDEFNDRWVRMGHGASVASALIRAFGSALEDLLGLELSAFFFNIADAVDVFMSSFSAFRDAGANLPTALWMALGDAIGSLIGKDISAWFNDTAVAVGELWAALGAFDVPAALAALEDLAVLSLTPTISILGWVWGMGVDLVGWIADHKGDIWDGLLSIPRAQLSILGWIWGLHMDLGAWVIAHADEIWDGVVNIAQATIDLAEIAWGTLPDLSAIALEFAGKIGTAISDAIPQVVGFAAGLGAALTTEVSQAVSDLIGNISGSDVFGFGEGLGAALRGAIINVVGFAAGLAETLGGEVIQAIPSLVDWVVNADWSSVATGIKDGIILAIQGLLLFGAAVVLALAGFLKGLVFGEGDVDWSGLATSIGSGIVTALAVIANPFTAFKAKILGWWEDLKDIFGGGATGFETSGEGGYGSGVDPSSIITDALMAPINAILDFEMPDIPNPFAGLGPMIQGWIDNIPMPSVPEWLKKMASGDIMGAIGAMIGTGDGGWGMSAPVTPPGYGDPGGQTQPGTDLNLGDPAVEPVGKAFVVPAPDFSKFLTAHDTAFADANTKGLQFVTDSTNHGVLAADGFNNTFILDPAVAHAGAVQGSLESIFSGVATDATNKGMVAGEGFNSGITQGTNQAVSQAGAAQASMVAIFSGIAASMTNLGIAGGQGFAFGVSSGMSQAVGSAYAGAAQIRGALSSIGNLYGEGYSIGSSLGQGIASGIAGMVGAVAAQAAGIVNAAVAAARNAGAIRSPSKVMAELVGKPLAQGVALGIRQGVREVDRAALGLVPSVRPNSVAGIDAYGATGAGGGIHVSVNFNEPVYGVDGLENAVVDIVVDKVVPAVAAAAQQRDRAIGVRR